MINYYKPLIFIIRWIKGMELFPNWLQRLGHSLACQLNRANLFSLFLLCFLKGQSSLYILIVTSQKCTKASRSSSVQWGFKVKSKSKSTVLKQSGTAKSDAIWAQQLINRVLCCSANLTYSKISKSLFLSLRLPVHTLYRILLLRCLQTDQVLLSILPLLRVRR
jgi:hypothetical protein